MNPTLTKDDENVPPAVTAEPVPDAQPLPFRERLSDRVNPIFLRELQQAFNAKAVLGIIGGAMAAIFLIGLLIALRADRQFGSGRDVFIAVLMVLTPVMTMVLPMQAFNSMQHELREGAVDQLLMSELNPRRIVRGKLLAAALLALIFMAAFAPLLAVTYLLRGIDVATIGICLGFCFLFGLGASAVGLAMGAVTMIKQLQQLARVGVSLGLAALTIGVMASTWEIVRDVSSLSSGRGMEEMVSAALAVVCGIVLMNMIAAAVLTHPYENRSTPFRVFPFGLTLVAYAIAWWMDPRDLDEFAWAWALTCAVGAIPFFLAALTEGKALSPRIRTLVPRNRVLALLAVPFLPGSDRGLWFMLLLTGTLVGCAELVDVLGAAPGRGFPLTFLRAGAPLALCYFVIWGCVLRWLRGDAPGQKARVRACVALVFLFALACAGPAVFDLATKGEIRGWTWPHLLNPFFTLVAERTGWRPLGALLVIAGALLLARLPGMVAGVREVLEASRARAR